MNLVYNIVFIITAIYIIIQDYKSQEFPILVTMLNYSSICLLIDPKLLVGNTAIVLLRNKPIDIVYIMLLGYILLFFKSTYSIVLILPILIQVIISKKEKISLMMSIEISYILYLLLSYYK